MPNDNAATPPPPDLRAQMASAMADVDVDSQTAIYEGDADPAPQSTPDPVPSNPSQPNPTQGGPAPAPKAPADPNLGAGGGAQQPPQGWQSIRDAAKAMGYRPQREHQTDQEALADLVRQAEIGRQQNLYAKLGQQYARQQSMPQQPAQPQQRNPLEFPGFDRSWGSFVDHDEATGLYIGKPGAPPDIVDKVNDWARWQKQWETQPDKILAHYADQAARKAFDEQFQQRQQQSQVDASVREIQAQNAAWLYQKDEAGNYRSDVYTGKPMLSPAGARYAYHVQQLAQGGMTDPRQQNYWARQAVENEIYALQAQQAQQAQQHAANPQNQQARQRPNQNANGTLPPSQGNVNPGSMEPTTTGLSLAETIRRAVNQEGYTDADFNFQDN